MKAKILVPATLVTVIAGFVIARSFYQTQESAAVKERAQVHQAALVRAHSPTLGASDGLEVVEFFDPECESCREFHPITKGLMKEYEGKLKLVLRYAPFHQNSVKAIRLLEAARKQNRYWEALDVLFQYQPQWGSHHDPRPELMWTYISHVPGIDMERLKTDVNDLAIKDLIELDRADGQALGVRMTPSFFVAGEPLTQFGPGPLRELIEKHLAAKK